MSAATAEIAGEVTDPSTGDSDEFTTAQPSASRANAHYAQLRNDALVLGLLRGQPGRELRRQGDTQEGLDCPLEVASVVLGRIEYLPAKSGTLIVDEISNCLASRFRVEFGEHGELGGWFSTPWSP